MFDSKIAFYPIFIIISLIANIIVVLLIYKKHKFNQNEIVGALVYENLGIIMGAKILSYLENYKIYGEFDFFSLGLSSYGGVIGAIVCLIIFGLQFKKPIKDMLFTFMPSIPLMYAIGKIGCFIVGCCHGIEYSGFGSVAYNHSLVAAHSVHLFPIQIVETIVFTLIFVYMIIKILKNKFDFKTLGISFMLCGVSKFCLDFLRASHVNLNISLNQILSIGFIVCGIILFINNKRKRETI